MFSSIVVGTDGSDTATQAVRQAVEVAKTASATLEIVSAYTPVPEQQLRQERIEAPEDVQWVISPRQEVEASLSRAAQIAHEAGVDVSTYACEGDPADAIVDVAETQNADLVIVANTRMTGVKRLLKRLLLASVQHRVSRRAPCSVLIVRTA
ncbi:MAG: universal stress protein [Solirubrobacteraceae bacterium]